MRFPAAALTFLAACGGTSYARGPVEAPAPAGALECARVDLLARRYTITAGAVADGYLNFQGVADGPTYYTTRVSYAGGILRAVSTGGGRQGQEDIRAMLAACAHGGVSPAIPAPDTAPPRP
jgi:hypothetical protein